MTNIALDTAVFRLQFSAYSDVAKYPDALLSVYFDMATNYISNKDYGYLSTGSRTMCLYLMMSHLLTIQDAANNGEALQAMAGGAEGSVSVTLVAPPAKDGWQWWLSSTAYGQQIWALLNIKAVGGFYVGGARNTAGIRRPSGNF